MTLWSASPEGIVEWHGHGNGGSFGLQLHDPVAATLPHRYKSASLKNLADFPS
jgi:hypothetical protein